MVNHSRTKLCWNCESRVGLKEEHCPCCGVYLSPTSMYGEVEDNPLSESSVRDELNKEQSFATSDHQDDNKVTSKFSLNLMPSHAVGQLCMSLGFLLFGSAFFLFGITLSLFAKDGVLTLKWESDYWYYYLVLSAGLLFFGWRNLKDLEPDSVD